MVLFKNIDSLLMINVKIFILLLILFYYLTSEWRFLCFMFCYSIIKANTKILIWFFHHFIITAYNIITSHYMLHSNTVIQFLISQFLNFFICYFHLALWSLVVLIYISNISWCIIIIRSPFCLYFSKIVLFLVNLNVYLIKNSYFMFFLFLKYKIIISIKLVCDLHNLL